MITVMLVDDHALVRMGFQMLLAAQAEMSVVGTAMDGEQACADYPRLRPDVVIMDLSMPGMGGLEAVRRLLAQDPKVRVLVLSAYEDPTHARRVLRAGALGYLAKRSSPEALVEAVTAVAANMPYLDAHTAQSLAIAESRGQASPTEALSAREFTVFLHLAHGLSVAQIAGMLNVAPSTVGTHLFHIKQKLGAANQAEITLVALRWNLLAL